MKRKACLRGLLSVLFVLPALFAFAYDVTGQLTSMSGDPLIGASVSLLKANKDSTYVKGGMADDEGGFKLSGVSSGKYLLKATYLGFKPKFVPITVSNANVKLGAIGLDEEGKLLAEVVIQGVRTPIRVATDTIEYSADAYTTRPNAVVEDLLKRLPGVEVGEDGSITANGKTVTKILLDGKEFFTDDPKVASKNLPAEIVDRLQVVDRKSDLARLTGVDDGEDETVINLTVKKGMKNGWFGNAQGGIGTNSRYMGSFNVSRFQNENQFTFLGNLNNINELGFTDSNGQRFHRFGGDRGVTKSQAFGLNFNVGKGDVFRVGGDILYSTSNAVQHMRSERQYLFPDSTSYNTQNSASRNHGRNVKADFRMLWKPDSLNTLEIRPSFTWNINNSLSTDSAFTRAGDPSRTMVNRTLNMSKSHGNSLEGNVRVIYSHNFASRKGRSLSLMAQWRGSNVHERENSFSYNRFYLLGDSIDQYDQYMTNHTWSNTLRGRVTWKEPLGDVKNGNFLVLSYDMRYRWNDADKLIYDRYYDNPSDGTVMPGGAFTDVENPDLSNVFRNRFFTQNYRVGYQKVTSALNAEFSVNFVPSASLSTNLTNSAKSIPTRHVFNVSPFVRVRYKFSKNSSFQFNYRSRASEPSMTQLQPIMDVSDPLDIKQGNPDLDPSFTHFIMFRFQDFKPESQQSIMSMAHFQVVQNSIVSRTTYNAETGGRSTTYQNVNGVWNGRLMVMYSRPLRNKLWTVQGNLFTNFNRSVGFTNDARNATMTSSINFEPGIAFRPANFDIDIRPFYRLQTTSSSIPTQVGRTVHGFGTHSTLTAYTNWGLSLHTDLDYTATRGYSQGYNTNLWMWEAQISQEFLRDRSLTLAVKVHDILNQTQNINRAVTASYISDTEYNTLGRYGMVTLTYRFNTFGKGHEPQGKDMMHGDRPGPPPGMGHRH